MLVKFLYVILWGKYFEMEKLNKTFINFYPTQKNIKKMFRRKIAVRYSPNSFRKLQGSNRYSSSK